MPLKTSTDQVLSQVLVDTYEVESFSFVGGDTPDKANVRVRARKEPDGEWHEAVHEKLAGADLLAVMADAFDRVKADASGVDTTTKALALREAVKAALYTGLQALGKLPAGTVS